MKLTAFLLFVCCLQVSANGFAQGKITMKKANASLEEILLEINKQTGVLYSANNETLQKAKKVDINVKNADLAKVLSICFEGQPLTYSLRDNIIIVKEKPGGVKLRIEDERIFGKPIDVQGRVVNEKGEPVSGVTVTIKGTKIATSTNSSGEFSLSSVDQDATLVFTHISLETFELEVSGKTELSIVLKTKVSALGDVTVTVNTGYEKLPKERATGSFEQVSNSLYSRQISTDVISRLEGITTALGIDKRSGTQTLSIRGINSFNPEATRPLIVLDNFPYEGDLINVNPNDVESITILKDAAAASIWGSRAGNGVIVITTKKGKLNQPFSVAFNSNVTLFEKPDLSYYSQMKSEDFIDVEKMLFSKGEYDFFLDYQLRPVISPVVEILNKRRLGSITAEDSARMINDYVNNDIRNDFEKYVYRNGVNQQYALTVNGGTSNHFYSVSLGYDYNMPSQVKNNSDRATLRISNGLKPTKNLTILFDVAYTQRTATINNSLNYPLAPGGFKANLYPYARLADDDGNHSVVAKDYRDLYTDTAGMGKLLDWKYRPLDEINLADNTSKTQDIIFNLGIQYVLSPAINFEVKSQYEKQSSSNRSYYSPETYYARNLINRFTQIQGNTVNYRIPLGGILDVANSELRNQGIRTQVNFNQTFNKKHQISGLFGAELRETGIQGKTGRTYGYDENLITFVNVDYVNLYPIYGGLSQSNEAIPSNEGFDDRLNRTVSIYGNAAYTYDTRYTITLSGRRDAANVFGVATNEKWQPLWSIGGSWSLSRESFFPTNIFSSAKLRATYGYSGNINGKTGSVTITYNPFPEFYTNLNSAYISGVYNPNLRWEKVGMANIGLDFTITGNRVSGTIEYYRKYVRDLFAPTPVDPTVGFSATGKNLGEIKGRGIELQINTRNLTGTLQWETNFSLRYNKDLVEKYIEQPSTAVTYVRSNGLVINPIVGRELYGIYSYKWAGLDPATGDPQGYLKKEISKNYQAIANDSMQNLIYNGSALPLYQSFFRNTLIYKQFSFSFNITAKFNYFFRRPTINYYNLYYSWSTHADYYKRWIKAGDEATTTVPSMPYPAVDNYRDDFYGFSEVNVERGDHIRLNDISFGYIIPRFGNYKKIKNIRVYGYINNIGIIWKATSTNLDPDYYASYLPAQRSYAIGINANF